MESILDTLSCLCYIGDQKVQFILTNPTRLAVRRSCIYIMCQIFAISNIIFLDCIQNLLQLFYSNISNKDSSNQIFFQLLSYKNKLSILFLLVDLILYTWKLSQTQEDQLKQNGTELRFEHLKEVIDFKEIDNYTGDKYESLIIIDGMVSHSYTIIIDQHGFISDQNGANLLRFCIKAMIDKSRSNVLKQCKRKVG